MSINNVNIYTTVIKLTIRCNGLQFLQQIVKPEIDKKLK